MTRFGSIGLYSLFFHPLSLLSLASLFLLIITAFGLRSKSDKETRLLCDFYFIDLFFTLLSAYLGWNKIRNLWAGNIYILIEYGVFLWILSRWSSEATARKMMAWSIVAFVAVWLVIMVGFDKFNDREPLIFFFQRTGILLACGRLLYEYAVVKNVNLFQEPRAAVCIAFLFYAAATFFHLLFRATAIQALTKEEAVYFQSLYWVILIFSHAVFLYPYWLIYKAQPDRLENPPRGAKLARL